MVGKRHSGKGFSLKYLLHYLVDQFETVILFSGSEQEDSAWAGIIPESFVYDRCDGDALARIIETQRKRVKEHKAKGDTREREPNLLLIFDDIMQDANTFSRDKAMQEIFFSGR